MRKLKSDIYKEELKRYYGQLSFLINNKEDWTEDSYHTTKTFYDGKIKELRKNINQLHPEWLHQFDTDRANETTIREGIELVTGR